MRRKGSLDGEGWKRENGIGREGYVKCRVKREQERARGVNWRSGGGVQPACISVGYRSPLGLTDRPALPGVSGWSAAPWRSRRPPGRGQGLTAGPNYSPGPKVRPRSLHRVISKSDLTEVTLHLEAIKVTQHAAWWSYGSYFFKLN